MAMSAADAARAAARDLANNKNEKSEKSAASRVVTRSMSTPDVVFTDPPLAPPSTALDPPLQTSHSDAANPALVLSPVVSSPSASPSRPSLQCSREQEDMLGSLVDTLSPPTMAKLLSTFAIAPAAPAQPTTSQPSKPTPPPQTTDSVAADRQMAVNLAAIDATVARVDDRAKKSVPYLSSCRSR